MSQPINLLAILQRSIIPFRNIQEQFFLCKCPYTANALQRDSPLDFLKSMMEYFQNILISILPDGDFTVKAKLFKIEGLKPKNYSF